MLESKKKILDANIFLNNRRHFKQNNIDRKDRNILLSLAVILGLILILLTYFLSDASNIYRVSISGNIYLSDEEILKISSLDHETKYIFVSKHKTEKRIKENKLIKNCKVDLLANNVVQINVDEFKAIGYSFEDNNNVLIIENDERIILGKDNVYLIEKVPLIYGFNAEDIVLLEKNLKEIDYKLINEISEIHYYPNLKYQNIMLIMRDGNYIFTSTYGLYLLDKYHEIGSSYDNKENECYYFEDISGNAYVSACPWNTVNKVDAKNETEE